MLDLCFDSDEPQIYPQPVQKTAWMLINPLSFVILYKYVLFMYTKLNVYIHNV